MNEITKRVRTLRSNQTPAEKLLWRKLRYLKLGVKFRRQYPITFYLGEKKYCVIADFFCKSAKLVIEIDGGIHERQKEYDKARTFLINEIGYKVIRFTNEEVYSDIVSVVGKILSVL